MVRFTIVTRLRLLAAIAPAILLIAAPFIGGGLYVFGRQIEVLQERELAGRDAARGMDVALYQMEWARTQHDRDEILLDQRRAFAHWIDLAGDRSDTESQRRLIAAIAQQAGPLFDRLRVSAPEDESVDANIRNLHGHIADLIDADDGALLELGAASRRQATRLMAAMLAAGIAIPWLCFAALYAAGGVLRRELGAIRESFERMRERPAAPASDPDASAIDASLTRLGFPKPNPMLAE